MDACLPWQLRMFKKTLKKQIRLKFLIRLLTAIDSTDRCLLVTCGDNNGAMNYYLRELGGQWSWCDLEMKSIEEMALLLGDEVKHGSFDALPFSDDAFDRTVSIDCLEHIESPDVFTRELHRITAQNGQVIITVPSGDQKKVVNRLKNMMGMTKEAYGHMRDGMTVGEVRSVMRAAQIRPTNDLTFSKFFTEMLELSINFLYVKVLSKKSDATVEEGTIAPATQDQLKSVDKTYKMYSLVYPLFKMISFLDNFLIGSQGYVTMVEGRKHG